MTVWAMTSKVKQMQDYPDTEKITTKTDTNQGVVDETGKPKDTSGYAERQQRTDSRHQITQEEWDYLTEIYTNVGRVYCGYC